MKKFQIDRFRQGSAQYVVAHGKFQKSRGRNPSLSYKGLLNPRLALQTAEEEIANQERQEQELSNHIREKAKELPRVWRMDVRENERPTTDFDVIHAEDLVGIKFIFKAYVLHVNTCRGKGFRALVKSQGSIYSSLTFHGTTPVQYEAALEAAYTHLEREIKILDELMKEQYDLFMEHHRHKSNRKSKKAKRHRR